MNKFENDLKKATSTSAKTVHMQNKHLRHAVRQMQIKPTVRQHFTSVRMGITTPGKQELTKMLDN